jgi:hypothetical protein
MTKPTPDFNGQKPRDPNPGRQPSAAGGEVKIGKLPVAKPAPKTTPVDIDNS